MRTTIDGAGRIVVPKALRDALSLEPRQELEVRIAEGRLEIEPAPTLMTLRPLPAHCADQRARKVYERVGVEYEIVG